MEWINIKDELPKIEGVYNVKINMTDESELRYFDGLNFINYHGYRVTHWWNSAKIVKLPKKEKLWNG